MRSLSLLVFGAALLSVSLLLAGPTDSHEAALPRFTEEREAAALFFLHKHLPEVLPLMQVLKKNNPTQYQKEIRDVFQVTEMLANLRDDPPRHDLELKIWKTESKAHALLAKFSTARAAERAKIEASLKQLARELVDLDIQVLELKADQLDKELNEVKEELSRARDQLDRDARERYDLLLRQAKKRKK